MDPRQAEKRRLEFENWLHRRRVAGQHGRGGIPYHVSSDAGLPGGLDLEVCDPAGGESHMECPQGHQLQTFHTPHQHYRCDVCSRPMRLGERAHGCRVCNYDVCRRCPSVGQVDPEERARRRDKAADDAHMQQWNREDEHEAAAAAQQEEAWQLEAATRAARIVAIEQEIADAERVGMRRTSGLYEDEAQAEPTSCLSSAGTGPCDDMPPPHDDAPRLAMQPTCTSYTVAGAGETQFNGTYDKAVERDDGGEIKWVKRGGNGEFMVKATDSWQMYTGEGLGLLYLRYWNTMPGVNTTPPVDGWETVDCFVDMRRPPRNTRGPAPRVTPAQITSTAHCAASGGIVYDRIRARRGLRPSMTQPQILPSSTLGSRPTRTPPRPPPPRHSTTSWAGATPTGSSGSGSDLGLLASQAAEACRRLQFTSSASGGDGADRPQFSHSLRPTPIPRPGQPPMTGGDHQAGGGTTAHGTKAKGPTKQNKTHPGNITAADLKRGYEHLSSKHVKKAVTTEVYKVHNKHDPSMETRYTRTDTVTGETVRVSKNEYDREHRQGGHLLDAGFAASVLNKMRGPALKKDGDKFKLFAEFINSQFRTKTALGNQVTDATSERKFKKFYETGEWTGKWTPADSAKLKQYRKLLDKVDLKFKKELQPQIEALEDGVDKLETLMLSLEQPAPTQYSGRGRPRATDAKNADGTPQRADRDQVASDEAVARQLQEQEGEPAPTQYSGRGRPRATDARNADGTPQRADRDQVASDEVIARQLQEQEGEPAPTQYSGRGRPRATDATNADGTPQKKQLNEEKLKTLNEEKLMLEREQNHANKKQLAEQKRTQKNHQVREKKRIQGEERKHAQREQQRQCQQQQRQQQQQQQQQQQRQRQQPYQHQHQHQHQHQQYQTLQQQYQIPQQPQFDGPSQPYTPSSTQNPWNEHQKAVGGAWLLIQ